MWCSHQHQLQAHMHPRVSKEEIGVTKYVCGGAERCRMGQCSRRIIQNRGSTVAEIQKQRKQTNNEKMLGTIVAWQRHNTCGEGGRTLVCSVDKDQLTPPIKEWSELAELVHDHLSTCSSMNKRDHQSVVQPKPETRKPEADQKSVSRIIRTQNRSTDNRVQDHQMH